MNRFFNYHNSLCSGINTYNVFSYDPYIIAIKEVLISEIKTIAYYIEKLCDLNVDMTLYTDKVIEFISVLIVNLDFRKESFFVIIDDLYKNRKTLEKLYISACEKVNINYDLLTDKNLDLSLQENVLKILNEQEQKFQKNNDFYDKNKRSLCEIIIILVLNACNGLIELNKFNCNLPSVKKMVLKLLNTLNIPSLTDDVLIGVISDFSKFNYEITKLLNEKNIEYFGPISKTKVLTSHKKGKAILVSASSLSELEKLLKAVQGLNINIYTHNEMITAFQYQNINKYSNLTGNYKKSDNNLFIDFASFPGPIYVSKNSILKTDVIRGQIYTSARYPAYGIGKIINDDFSPIINSAIDSSGFDDDESEKYIEIGYNISDADRIINEVSDKYNNGNINRIIIIGLIDGFNLKNEYIGDLIDNSNETDFIFSFAYSSNKKNVVNLNPFYDFCLLYHLIEKLNYNIPSDDIKLAVFLPDCNSATVSHILNLIYLKVKYIFLGPCCPNIINSALIDGLLTYFNINEISQPKDDLQKIK